MLHPPELLELVAELFVEDQRSVHQRPSSPASRPGVQTLAQLTPFWLKLKAIFLTRVDLFVLVCLVDHSSLCRCNDLGCLGKDGMRRIIFPGPCGNGFSWDRAHHTICEVADEREAQCFSRFFTSPTNHAFSRETTPGRQSCVIGRAAVQALGPHAERASLKSLQDATTKAKEGKQSRSPRQGRGRSEGQCGLSGSIHPSVGRCRSHDTQSSPGCIGESQNSSQWCSSRCETRFVCQVGHCRASDTSCICGRGVEGGGGSCGVPSCRSSCADAPNRRCPVRTWKPMCPACSKSSTSCNGVESVASRVPAVKWTKRSKMGRIHQHPVEGTPTEHFQVPPVRSTIRVERLPCWGKPAIQVPRSCPPWWTPST